MIPNSLKIALAVGTCSGVLVGLLFANLQDAGRWDVKGIPMSGIYIMTDKDEYGRGDLVQIRITNNAGHPVIFPSSPVRACITALDGTYIGGREYGRPVTMQPGNYTQYAWDQTKDTGQQVFDGVYVISICDDIADRHNRATILIHGTHPTLRSLLSG